MAIAGYKLRLNGAGITDQVTDVGNVLTYTFTGLEANTEYAVEVASYDDVGTDSIWSAPVLATTEAGAIMYVVLTDDGEVMVTDDGEIVTILE